MSNSTASSNFADAIRAVIGFFLLILAEFGVRPLFAERADVDFALIAIIFSAAHLRPGFSAVVGCVTGLILDAMSPATFGLHAVAFALIAYSASRLRAVFFTGHIGLTGVFVFVGKWLTEIVLILLGGTASGMVLAAELVVWAPVAAALTAAVAVLLLVLFRPIFRLPSA